jgi:hypothetical protein
MPHLHSGQPVSLPIVGRIARGTSTSWPQLSVARRCGGCVFTTTRTPVMRLRIFPNIASPSFQFSRVTSHHSRVTIHGPGLSRLAVQVVAAYLVHDGHQVALVVPVDNHRAEVLRVMPFPAPHAHRLRDWILLG